MHIVHLAAIAAFAAVVAAPASAAQYSTQASFLAANPSTTLVSFTGLTSDLTQVANPYSLGGLTFTGLNPAVVSTSFWGSVDSLLDNRFNGFLSISLASSTSIGFFLANSYGSGTSPTITFSNGANTVFTVSPVAGGVNDAFSYYGVDGIGAFDTVLISANGDNNFVSIGEVSFGGAVPEPASWAMLIAGFGLVGAAARRRRFSQATAAA